MKQKIMFGERTAGQKLGDNLKDYRQFKKMSLQKIGELLGMKRQYLSIIELGRIDNPREETVSKISNLWESDEKYIAFKQKQMEEDEYDGEND